MKLLKFLEMLGLIVMDPGSWRKFEIYCFLLFYEFCVDSITSEYCCLSWRADRSR